MTEKFAEAKRNSTEIEETNKTAETARYDFSEIMAALQKSQYPLLTGHVSPDADAVGSALALALALERLGKESAVVFKDDIPDYLKFMPGAEKIIKPDQLDEKRDLLVMVDCASPKRIGKIWSEPWFAKIPCIAVDHHETNDGFVCCSLVDAKAAANSQIVYYLVQALGVALDKPLATCLFAGISGDTGGFRFSNTNRETMEIGGRLMDLGVDTQEVRIQLFECKSMKDMAMIGVGLENMRQSADGKLVWTSISLKEKTEHGAAESNCENISDYTMYPVGVKVGIFFQEMPNGMVKMSMRCRDGYNVAKVAKAFDGGGHVVAAGCRAEGELRAVMAVVLAEAEKMIAEAEAEKNQKAVK